MHCFSDIIACCTSTLEHLGLYEPEIDIHEAESRLQKEREIWSKVQRKRDEFWNQFQEKKEITNQISPLVESAIIQLQLNIPNLQKGVAVDLGCGISNTIFNLLERGWNRGF